MKSSTRGGFLIAGSIIAFLFFLIPGLYGVSYVPPTHATTANIALNKLKDFGGPITSANAGVYNGFSGPIDLNGTLLAIIVMAILGFLAEVIDLDKAVNWVKQTHPILSVASQLYGIGTIIWQFRYNQTPSQVTQKFIADLGGGQAAIAASHYLSASLGLGFLLLFFGFLVGSVGAYSKVGCALLTFFILLFVGALVYTRVTTGAW